MASPTLFVLSAFLLGLLFGSFLNVCITRLPAHQSIVTPRSHCPHCDHPIRWYDNIPILSFLLLRARCRDCKAPISRRYLSVELAVGLLWALDTAALWDSLHCQIPDLCPSMMWTPTEHTFYFFRLAILGFLLIGLLVMDWQTLRLPDAFTFPGIAIGFLLTCAQAAFLPTGQGDIALNTTHQLRLSSPGSGNALGNVFLTGTEALIYGRIAAILGAALILLAIRWIYKALRHQEGLGLGDIKLLAMIAAFLGFTQSLLALFAGVITASLYGITLLARRSATHNTRLPFGSFLAAGGLFAALVGPAIVNWYTNLLR